MSKPDQFPVEEILNNDDRLAKGWGSVEVRDVDGEMLPMAEFKKLMPVIMDRGGPIIDMHSNRQVGKIINYNFEEEETSKKEGVKLTYKIFSNFESDDKVWEEIKSGERKGLSFGGKAKKSRFKFDKGGKLENTTKILYELEGYEFSSVQKPANQLGLNTEVNYLAKGYLQKKVERRGEKWAVVHCTGPNAGKAISTHDTEEQAQAAHRAIQANKQDNQPPEGWWEKCTTRASKFADDPEGFCGALWDKAGDFPAGAKLRESFGKQDGNTLLKETIVQFEKSVEDKKKMYETPVTKEDVAKLTDTLVEMTKKMDQLSKDVAEIKSEKQEKPDEEKKPEDKKPEDEEKKQKQDEKPKEKPEDEEMPDEEKKEKQEKEKLPAPAGEDDTVSGKPSQAEGDKGGANFAEKMEEVAKAAALAAVEEVKKSFTVGGAAPRPGSEEIKKGNEGKEETDMILKVAQGEKKLDPREVTKMQVKKQDEELAKVFDGGKK